MTFEEILDQAIAMLQRRGRLTYGTLKRQFALDEDALNDLKAELLYAHPEVHDDAGRGLVWRGDVGTASSATSALVEHPGPAPLAYTPPYLAEKILTSRSALAGERKHVTVLFADLKGSMELLADRDPFFTTKHESGGTGLGLAITTSLVRIHGGQLTFASAPCKGTRALVTLLCHDGQAPSHTMPPARQETSIP
jgi:hypothetical protein